MLSIQDPIHAFEPLWGQWFAEELIGEGNYGRVYRASRHLNGGISYSAIKLLSVPRNAAESEAVLMSGLSEAECRAYFEAMVGAVWQEIKLLSTLRDCPHVVHYEDHLMWQHPRTLIWSIAIRMELLTPLSHHLRAVGMEESDVVRLGIEVCQALEACRSQNILHRDIKDANIFVAQDGTFKLGDFGIALESAQLATLRRMHGTPLYAAPEVYRGESCDHTADLYALGMTLYRLCNHNRLPFMPPVGLPVTEADADRALQRRLAGEKLPEPVGIEPALWRIIEKACAYQPIGRFGTAAEMAAALRAVQIRRKPQRVLRIAPPDSALRAARTSPPKLDPLRCADPNPRSGFLKLWTPKAPDTKRKLK